MDITFMNKLEPGIYELKRESNGNNNYSYIFNTLKRTFDTPKKIYGEYLENVNHIFSYYKMSGATMGCLFHGEPGAGKSLTSELLCNLAVSHQMPVVYIQGVNGSNSLIAESMINLFKNFRNMVIYIDEFAKIFPHHTQNMFLSILTDASANNLWILTENEESSVSKFISRRPGRIRYNIEFNKISERAVIEYCDDMKVSDSFKAELMAKYDSTDMFTFDQLKAIVSEEKFNIALYGKSKPIDEICMMLNVKDVMTSYLIKPREIKYNGIVLDKDRLNGVRINLTCRYLRSYGEPHIAVTSREYQKLMSQPSTIECDVKIDQNAVKTFTEPDMRNNKISLSAQMENNMSYNPNYTEESRGIVVKENIDGIEKRFISFQGEYFQIILGIFTKSGEEIFLQ